MDDTTPYGYIDDEDYVEARMRAEEHTTAYNCGWSDGINGQPKDENLYPGRPELQQSYRLGHRDGRLNA